MVEREHPTMNVKFCNPTIELYKASTITEVIQ